MLISNNFISVSLFITLFLGFLTLERITIYIKREYDKEVKSEVTKDISDVKEMNIRIRRQRDFWRNKYFLVSNAIKDKKIKVN